MVKRFTEWVKLRCGICQSMTTLQMKVEKENGQTVINIRCKKCIDKNIMAEIDRCQLKLFESDV